MNKVDMTGIRSSIVSIYTMLRNQQEKVTAYHQEYEETKLSKDLSDDGKKKKIADLTAKLKEATARNFRNFESTLDNILAAGQANAAIFDINSTKLQTTIQLINAVGKRMDQDTQDNIIRSFIGEQQSLKMLKSLFQANGLNTNDIDKHIFSIENYVEGIRGESYFIISYPDVSKGNAKQLTDVLSDLADICGIELTAEETFIGAGGYYGM
jgi:hypothetical protein